MITALIILATTGANASALSIAYLCPIRGLTEAGDCCCSGTDVVVATPPKATSCCDGSLADKAPADCSMGTKNPIAPTDPCACQKVLLVEDTSEQVVMVSSEFDFSPSACVVDAPWRFSHGNDRDPIRLLGRPPPRVATSPSYLLFSSWIC